MWLRETSTQWMDATPDAVRDVRQEPAVAVRGAQRVGHADHRIAVSAELGDHLPSAEA
jgi:hypothetical protein